MSGETRDPEDTVRASSGDPWLGRVLKNKYQLERLLGAGGFGAVYAARQLLMGTWHAVKLLHTPSSSQPDVVDRFREEARIGTQLRHPRIVAVTDFDVEGGTFFLVMDFIESVTLAQRLRQSPGDVGAQVEPWARDIAAALDYAHAQRVVHRDLKPSNILVREQDQAALLTDFGISRWLSSVGVTQAGTTLGTYAYMSPEQCVGEERAIDSRSDIYSFAALLFELECGRPPFGTGQEAMHSHLHQPVPSVRKFRADHPNAEQLDAVFAHGLAKSPDQRPQSARQLVEEFLDGRAGVAPTLGPEPVTIVGAPSPPAAATMVAPAVPPSGPPVTPPPPGRRPVGGLAWFRSHQDVLAALAIVALLGALVLGSTAFTRTAAKAQGEVVLQPTSSIGSNPFTPSLAKPQPSPSIVPSPPTAQAVTSVTGNAPGLYGGTRNNASCDREQMITFLAANPVKGRAWAQVEGITPADIPDYIRSLTPVVLRYDTRVTNHGFTNGVALPYQSVLQAGTAVLVDRYGVPRARCYCGNPLLPPIPRPVTPTYTGPPWPAFQPTTIIIVVQSPQPIQVLTLADPNMLPFGRPVGTDGTSDGDAPPVPVSPSPSAAPSPIGSPDPRTGNYKVRFMDGPGTVMGSAPEVTAANCTHKLSTTRMSVVVAGGTVIVTFLNAVGSGTLNSDGSFSVPLTFIKPPPTLEAYTVKGRLDGKGGITGTWEVVRDYPSGKAGCSYAFTGRKAT
jgi:serine/threonine protein kinase